MLELADRIIPGVGSRVTLYLDDKTATVAVSDEDVRKSFVFNVDQSQALKGFQHPYLFAPRDVLQAVNER